MDLGSDEMFLIDRLAGEIIRLVASMCVSLEILLQSTCGERLEPITTRSQGCYDS